MNQRVQQKVVSASLLHGNIAEWKVEHKARDLPIADLTASMFRSDRRRIAAGTRYPFLGCKNRYFFQLSRAFSQNFSTFAHFFQTENFRHGSRRPFLPCKKGPFFNFRAFCAKLFNLPHTFFSKRFNVIRHYVMLCCGPLYHALLRCTT